MRDQFHGLRATAIIDLANMADAPDTLETDIDKARFPEQCRQVFIDQNLMCPWSHRAVKCASILPDIAMARFFQ